MVECNVFDITTDLAGRKLIWTLKTDLPCETEVSVALDREYRNLDGEKCFWPLYDDSHKVESLGDLNGFSGELDIDEADAAGLKDYINEGDQKHLIPKTELSSEITLEIIVGAMQRNRAFGGANRNLEGAYVKKHENSNLRFIKESVVVEMPVDPKYSPYEG